MGITDKQREQRTKRIGSSDMAAILGVDPYRNIYDVWLEKTDRVAGFGGNAATEAGTLLEDGTLQFAMKELGDGIRNQFRSHPELPMGANIDLVLKGSSEPVDGKTSGLLGPLPVGWGEPGTDEVPDHMIVQVHVHMMCLLPIRVDLSHVSALLGGKGFRLYHIPRNPELCDVIAEKADHFWTKHVIADVPPPDVIPSLEVIKRARRTPGTVANIEESVVSKWQASAGLASQAVKSAKLDQAAVLAAMGDAEGAEYGDPEKMLTYFEQTRKGYTVDELTYRVLRNSKRKG